VKETTMPRSLLRISVLSIVVLGLVAGSAAAAEETGVRVATYNSSLFRDEDGELIRDLEGGRNEQARHIAEVIQRVRPEIMLVNEFDYDAQGRAATAFIKEYLAVGQNGCEPIEFPYHFIGPVNTGVPSGRDLSKNGSLGEPQDAIGFGKHPGEYAMLVLSKYPIDKERARTFQKFLWRDMLDAKLPVDPQTGKLYYDDDDLAVLRLSSKSHFDVPIQVPAKGDMKPFVLHLLASHPTPPVFDGKEDRNGRRNHDEIRMVADLIDPNKGEYLVDDAGKKGGLSADALFVIVGDLNCDPIDGQGLPGTMDQLLKSPRVNASFTPSSEGGRKASEQGGSQSAGRGDPAHDTSNFGEFQNLRIDYALPSKGLKVLDGGIFWPVPGEPGSEAITATDHRSVWIVVRPE
jgi:endonuclease/exonuclease/phosphatase family protein